VPPSKVQLNVALSNFAAAIASLRTNFHVTSSPISAAALAGAQVPADTSGTTAELIATEDDETAFAELEVAVFDDAGFATLELDFTDALLLTEVELFEVALLAVALLELPDLSFSLEEDAFCLPESLDFAVDADEVFLEEEDFATLELDFALLALDFFTDELDASSS